MNHSTLTFATATLMAVTALAMVAAGLYPSAFLLLASAVCFTAVGINRSARRPR